jgi:hypothetical protein
VTTKTETQIPGCFVRFDSSSDFWGEGFSLGLEMVVETVIIDTGRGLERVFRLFWRNGFILLYGFMRCIVFDLVLGWKFLGCCFDCCACLIWCWFLNFLVWVLDGPCSDYLESNQATVDALSLSLSLSLCPATPRSLSFFSRTHVLSKKGTIQISPNTPRTAV